MTTENTNYTQGYSKATVASHAARSVDTDANFLVSHIKPTDTILDVGCGPGTITVGFGTLTPQGSVIGVDISDDVLSPARETAEGADNVTFQKADILAGLPFPDDNFDVVYNSQLFPHLATLDMRIRALSEMRRVLKPGGILASRDAAELHFYPRAYDLDRLWAGNMVKGLRNGEPDACFPGGDMPALFQQVGFDAANGKVKIGAGTTVHSGTETRRWFVAASLGKLQPGDTFRDSWRRAGITDQVIEQTQQALVKWAEDNNAWYVALQAEIMGWK